MREYKTIDSDSIDFNDKRFDYHDGYHDIETDKPNELPVFWKNGKRYIPVLLNKKIKKGSGVIHALVYSEDSTYESVLSDMLKLSQQHHHFDLAKFMRLLEKYAPDHNKEVWSKKMGIGKHQWDNIEILNYYEKNWKYYLISKNVPLKRILRFSNPDIRKLLDPLLEMNPGINLLESIATLLQDISIIKKISVGDVWKNSSLQQTLENEEMSSSQKLQEIRRSLYEMRYPTIANFRKQMSDHLNNISLSKGVKLRIDENFETPGMQISAEIRNKRDVDSFKKWLEAESKKLERIMDIQKGKK